MTQQTQEQDKQREAFEKWARWCCYNIERAGGNVQYRQNTTEQMWLAWQAASAQAVPTVVQTLETEYAAHLKRCRDAFPVPPAGSDLEALWSAALDSTLCIADYVEALAAAPQPEAQAAPVDAKHAVQMPDADKLMEQIKEWAVSDLLAAEAALDAHCPDPPQSILDAEKSARDFADAQLAAIEQQVRAMLAAPAAPMLQPLTDEQITRAWRNTPAQGDPTGMKFAIAFARQLGIGAPSAD